MKNLVKVLMVLALGAVICLPGIASAYPTVDLYEVGVNNNVTTNIFVPGYGNLDVYTGNYIVSLSNPSDSGNPFFQYSGYCVEPTLSSSTPRVYELLPIAEGSAFEAAAWILSQGYNGIPQSAVAQVAVWELTWDVAQGNSFDLTTGNFILNSGVSATDVTNLYNAALAGVAAGFDQSPYVIAHNPVGSTGWIASQDYIIGNVPLPPSALLLGSGLLGLVGLRWRRRQTS